MTIASHNSWIRDLRRFLNDVAQKGIQFARAWLARRADECQQCRECHTPVRPFERTCGQCGISYPANVSISAAILVVLLVGAILFVACF